jgi:predicted Zn-dependent protease
MVFLESSNVVPICPHCNSELKVMHFRALASTLGKRYVYFCPNCRKVLGISHRKGFWMG